MNLPEIQKLLKSCSSTFTIVNYSDGKLTLKPLYEVTFNDLATLSDLFRMINLSSEIVEEGYCETCSYTTSNVVIEISNIVLPGNRLSHE